MTGQRSLAVYTVPTGHRYERKYLGGSYGESVRTVARLTQTHRFTGCLLHTNFHTLEPWPLATTILECTSDVVPLVAVQPWAAPPLTVARTIVALAHLYGRRVDLNLVTGVRPEELCAAGDEEDHDARYRRLLEFARCLRGLLDGPRPFDFDGQYFKLRRVAFEPALPEGLLPRVFLAGNSDAAYRTAAEVADLDLFPPTSLDDLARAGERLGGRVGLAAFVGILARDTDEEAYAAAAARFPVEREGRVGMMVKSRSSSRWVRDVATSAMDAQELRPGELWLGPCANGHAHCPYIVGSHATVAESLRRFVALGTRALVLDGPFHEDDFVHTAAALDLVDRVEVG